MGHNLNLNFDGNIDYERYLPVNDFECFNEFEPATLPEIKDILCEFDDLSSGCDKVLAGLGHFGRGHLGRGHYGRGHFGRGHLGRGHFGPLIQRILYS